jgi:hypothetical protein
MTDPKDRQHFQNFAAYWTRMAKEAGREAKEEKTG